MSLISRAGRLATAELLHARPSQDRRPPLHNFTVFQVTALQAGRMECQGNAAYSRKLLTSIHRHEHR